MATIKILLKSPSTTSPIIIQIQHAGKTEVLISKYRIKPECFAEDLGHVRYLNGMICKKTVHHLNETLQKTTRLLQQRIALLDASSLPYSVDEICEGIDFQGEAIPKDLFTFFRIQIALKAARHKYASQQLYTAALHTLQHYAHSSKYPFSHLTRDFVAGYIEYLNNRKLAAGTISKYMAILHTICFRASCLGVEINRERLFAGLHPAVGRSAKRAVDKSVLAKIARLKLDNVPSLKYASDLFLFSFFAQGMSLIDILHLKKENIRNGQIHYARAKCGTRICLGITPQMKSIIDTYCQTDQNEGHLFPTLRGIEQGSVAEYKTYRATLRATNRALLKISGLLHLQVPLTTYVARHTWATNAKKAHIPIPVIQEALGHTSIRTTEIYLQQFETRMIEQINARITRL